MCSSSCAFWDSYGFNTSTPYDKVHSNIYLAYAIMQNIDQFLFEYSYTTIINKII